MLKHPLGLTAAQIKCFVLKVEPSTDILKQDIANLRVHAVIEMGSEALQTC